MANILFKKGNYELFEKNVLGITRIKDNEGKVTGFEQGPKNIQEGALYLTEDEGGLYLGTSSSTVKRIQGSVIFYEDTLKFKEEVIDVPPYRSDVIYFISSDNALVRWVDESSNPNLGRWVVLNATAADVTNQLNVLTTAIAAEKTRAEAEEARLAGLIATNTSNISTNATNIASKAEQSDLNALDAKVESVKGDVAQNATDIASANTAIAAEKNRAEGEEARLSGLIAGNTTAIQTNATNIGKKADSSTVESLDAYARATEAKASANASAIEAANTAIAAETARATGKEAELLGKISANEVLIQGNADAIALKASDEDLKKLTKRVEDAETEIGDNATAISEANTAIAGEVTRAKAEEARLSGLIGGLDTKVTGLDNALKDKASNDSVNSLGEQLNTQSGKISGLEGKNADQDTEIAALKVANTALVEKDTAFQTELNGIKENVATLTTQVENKVKQSEFDTFVEDTYTKKIASIETSIGNNTTAIDALDSRVDVIESWDLDDKLSKSAGGTVKGKITMSNGATITGITMADAPADSDVVNVKYVANSIKPVSDRVGVVEQDLKTQKTSIAALDATVDAMVAEVEKATDGTTVTAVKLANNINANNKIITGLETDGTDNTSAANVEYVKNYVANELGAGIAANDAMTFKGVLTTPDTGDTLALPSDANAAIGDTYKVGVAGNYSYKVNENKITISAKVGDLIINDSEADGVPTSWAHVSSGYEDDYLQKLKAENNIIYLTDGVHSGPESVGIGSIKIIGADTSNLSFTMSQDTSGVITVAADMVWGTFSAPANSGGTTEPS